MGLALRTVEDCENDSVANGIYTYDVPFHAHSIIRLSTKIINDELMLDVRTWGISDAGKPYPRKGLCLPVRTWSKEVLSIITRICSDLSTPSLPVTPPVTVDRKPEDTTTL